MTTIDNLTEDLGQIYVLTPSQMIEMVEVCVEAGVVPFIVGKPGIGKTSGVGVAGANLGRRLIDIRGSQIDPVDLRGLPNLVDVGVNGTAEKRSAWAPPVFLPTADSDPTLIVLDELPAALPAVQTAFYSLLQERRIGEYHLPDNAAIVACGNREQDRGVFFRMAPALRNRFIQIEVTHDVQDWLEWAVGAALAPEVIFFIQWKDELLCNYDPASKDDAFATPRTWEYVSKLLDVMAQKPVSPMVQRAMFNGAVGEAAGGEFSSFLQIWRELPHPQSIIDDPHNAIVPDDASALLSTCGSLCRLADDVNFDSIYTYAKRLRSEVGQYLIGLCVARDPNLKMTRTWIDWTVELSRRV